ncbi:MAG: PEP-CTERM sorting domain-containing protein [Smithella sp.]
MTQPDRGRRNSAIILFVLLITVVISAVIYLISNKASSNSASQKIVAVNKESIQQDFDDSSFEKKGKWYGLCKKNSIHSIEDFKTTVSNDPVLKAHFASFNWQNAQTGKLEKATWAYVHYRKDNTVFRKEAPILLPAGDGYITDGITQIRTQCCNSYAAAPEPEKSEDPELDANPSAGLPPLSDLFQDSPAGEKPGQYTSSGLKYPYYTPISGHSVVPPSPPPSHCPPCPCGESKPASVRGQGSTPVIGKDNKTQTVDQSEIAPIPDYCYCPECPPSTPKPPPPQKVPVPSTIFLLGTGIGCLIILILALRKIGLYRG